MRVSTLRELLPPMRAMRIVWAAFLTAGVAEIVFFSVFDPFDLHFFGAPLDWSRQAIYTMGFFGFWGLGIAASTLSTLLEGRDAAGRDED